MSICLVWMDKGPIVPFGIHIRNFIKISKLSGSGLCHWSNHNNKRPSRRCWLYDAILVRTPNIYNQNSRGKYMEAVRKSFLGMFDTNQFFWRLESLFVLNVEQKFNLISEAIYILGILRTKSHDITFHVSVLVNDMLLLSFKLCI